MLAPSITNACATHVMRVWPHNMMHMHTRTCLIYLLQLYVTISIRTRIDIERKIILVSCKTVLIYMSASYSCRYTTYLAYYRISSHACQAMSARASKRYTKYRTNTPCSTWWIDTTWAICLIQCIWNSHIASIGLYNHRNCGQDMVGIFL